VIRKIKKSRKNSVIKGKNAKIILVIFLYKGRLS